MALKCWLCVRLNPARYILIEPNSIKSPVVDVYRSYRRSQLNVSKSIERYKLELAKRTS